MPSAERRQQVRKLGILEAGGLRRMVMAPLRRRRKLLAGRPTPEFIVSRTPLGIPERRIGFGRFLEADIRARGLRNIGVMEAREFSVGLLDLLQIGIDGHTEFGVVILVLHAFRPMAECLHM